jgi:RNA polymerase sigma factor (sigma-70 family)
MTAPGHFENPRPPLATFSGYCVHNSESTLTADDELIQGCRKGDRRAQQALFQRLSPRMYGVCLRYCSSREDAEDLLHDGFVKVFEKIGSFKGQSALETWMTRVFVNEAISRIRKRKSRGEWFTLDAEAEVADDAEEADEPENEWDADTVMQAVAALPDKYRIIINLYAIEQRTHKEISELLGIAEGASKSQLSRARAMLRELLHKK